MPRAVILECSHEAFGSLHEAVDRARKGTVRVEVEKASLEALLRDHAKLISLHGSEVGGIR